MSKLISFLSGESEKGFAIENVRRVMLVKIVIHFAMVFLLVFGVYSLLRNKPIVASGDFIAFLFLAASSLYLRMSHNWRLVSYIDISLMAVLFLFLIAHGDSRITGVLWTFTFPLFVISLLGTRTGSYVVAGFLSAAFILLLFGKIVGFAAYSADFAIKYTSAFFAVSILAFFFEYVHRALEHRLEERNRTLTIALRAVKEKERALKQSENTCYELVERSAEGIILIQDKVIRMINPSLCEMGGYILEDVIGKEFIRFVAPDQAKDVFANYLLRIANVVTPEEYETTILSKDGTRLTVLLRAGRLIYKGKPADLVFVKKLGKERTNKRRTCDYQDVSVA